MMMMMMMTIIIIIIIIIRPLCAMGHIRPYAHEQYSICEQLFTDDFEGRWLTKGRQIH